MAAVAVVKQGRVRDFDARGKYGSLQISETNCGFLVWKEVRYGPRATPTVLRSLCDKDWGIRSWWAEGVEPESGRRRRRRRRKKVQGPALHTP
jgi:hypothetical protein